MNEENQEQERIVSEQQTQGKPATAFDTANSMSPASLETDQAMAEAGDRTENSEQEAAAALSDTATLAGAAAQAAAASPVERGRHADRQRRFRGGQGRPSRALLIAAGVLVLILVGCGGGLLGSALAANRLEDKIENSFTDMVEEVGGVVLYRSVDTEAEELSNDDLSVAAVTELSADAVVEINTETEVTGWDFFGGESSYVVPGAGSGVIISDNGYILTCYHVIAEAQTVSVNLRNGDTYPATIVASDQQSDVAILKIDAEDLTVAVMGDSDKLSVGDLVVAIGNPLGELGGSVTSGIISALDREVAIASGTYNVIQTDAAINSGNSGGGLFNGQGELIGLVNAKASDIGVEGLAFALPINDLKAVIEDLLNYGYVTDRGVTLGVTLVNISDERTAASYRVDKLGCYILQVEEGSNAAYAGLQSGDRIVSIDGTAINEAQQVVDIISEHQVDDEIKMTISRNGEAMDFTITLYGKAPEADNVSSATGTFGSTTAS